jgi:hypothetical protein
MYSPSLAQSNFVIEGQVVNQETDAPIAYANVGIPGKYIGVATDEVGFFTLELPAGTESDTLQISAIGFTTKRLPVAGFKEQNNQTVAIQPKTYELNSITVTDKKNLETEWIGKKPNFFQRMFGRSGAYGEVGYGKNLGASYAFKIKWEKELPVRVLASRIHLERNDNDWPIVMRCRLQAVDPETGWPGEDILPVNVTASANNDGWITCDFSNKKMHIQKNNFFVVFEWLIEEDASSVVAPMFYMHKALDSEVYVRRKALGRWEKLSNNLMYQLKVEY